MKTMKFAAILAALGASLISIPALAADGWEAALTVSAGRAENELSFGQKSDATDGVDGKYDVPAMLAGDVKAYFAIGGGAYWRDIKPLGSDGKRVWKLKISSSVPGKIKVSWQPKALPRGGKMLLRDEKQGKDTDMSAVSEYSFDNDGPKELWIECGQPEQ